MHKRRNIAALYFRLESACGSLWKQGRRKDGIAT